MWARNMTLDLVPQLDAVYPPVMYETILVNREIKQRYCVTNQAAGMESHATNSIHGLFHISFNVTENEPLQINK